MLAGLDTANGRALLARSFGLERNVAYLLILDEDGRRLYQQEDVKFGTIDLPMVLRDVRRVHEDLFGVPGEPGAGPAELVAALDAPEMERRRRAARRLAGRDEVPDEARDGLIRGLRHVESYRPLAHDCARALSRMGTRAGQARGPLLELANRTEVAARVRAEALRALASVDPGEATTDELRRWLSAEPTLAAAAAESMANESAARGPVAAALFRALEYWDAEVRRLDAMQTLDTRALLAMPQRLATVEESRPEGQGRLILAELPEDVRSTLRDLEHAGRKEDATQAMVRIAEAMGWCGESGRPFTGALSGVARTSPSADVRAAAEESVRRLRESS